MSLENRVFRPLRRSSRVPLDVLTSIDDVLAASGIALLPPTDVFESLKKLAKRREKASTVLLDPWYGRGHGETPEDLTGYFLRLIRAAAKIADHVLFWGFPDLVAPVVPRLPRSLVLTAWITWAYKNSPSRVRGWRPGQMTCLHLSRPGAKTYPEHFLDDRQRELAQNNKLPFFPGPTTVIESGILTGWAGRSEQTGHPAQKPLKVIVHLLKMTCKPGDLVIDPMAGSGTTGAAALALNCRAILADHNPRYVRLMETRLGVQRVEVVTAPILAKIAPVTPADLERRRRKALSLLESGLAQAAVARELKVSRQSVSRWASERGPTGVTAKKRQGRSPKVSLVDLQRIHRAGPRKHGLAGGPWTGVRLAKAIERTLGVKIHPGHARALLRKLAAAPSAGPASPTCKWGTADGKRHPIPKRCRA